MIIKFLRNPVFLPALLLTVMAGCKPHAEMRYPETRKCDSADDYFGTVVADPYRWLENDTAPETEAWVEAQNAVTERYLSQIPFREKIRRQLNHCWNYPRLGVPFREGGLFFYFRNEGLQNQAVLYVSDGPAGVPRVLLDPNTLSADGTVALTGTSVSRDGKYLAYALSVSGSDWNEIRVMETATGKELPGVLQGVKFSEISWHGDGFYYSRFEMPVEGSRLSGRNEYHQVWFHRAGTQQSADRLIHADREHPRRTFSAFVTEDERYLVLYESESTSGNTLLVRDLAVTDGPWVSLAGDFTCDYTVAGTTAGGLLVMTNRDAPRKKLVLIDPAAPEPGAWKTVIPEREAVLESVSVAGGLLVAQYMEDAASRVRVFNMDGRFLHDMTLPGIGTLSGFSGKPGLAEAYYGFSSFTFPVTIYRYDIALNRSEAFSRPEVPGFSPDAYLTRQVFFQSPDGTSVPMFIVHRKDIVPDGNNPALLYGYGGFNISLTPSFSTSRLIFLENGGVLAVANLRGGGEYGEEWHKAGTKERKQNVFDDFIAAAEFLVAEKYTNPGRLAIMGGSNGGLLTGACMTRRPDLFRVAIPMVGVMDMLRYHRFTIGWAWAEDYGTSETKEGFDILYRYSPLHNLREGVAYPATLAFTADHDDRVVPAHTYKFMATLQEKQGGRAPVLVRIETSAGHGAGKPTAKLIAEATDLWSFVFFNLGMKPE